LASHAVVWARARSARLVRSFGVAAVVGRGVSEDGGDLAARWDWRRLRLGLRSCWAERKIIVGASERR